MIWYMKHNKTIYYRIIYTLPTLEVEVAYFKSAAISFSFQGILTEPDSVISSAQMAAVP
jgi:hypothetical protein